MHHVQSSPEHYWNNGNLEKCFVDTLRLLLQGLQNAEILDVFFPEVPFYDIPALSGPSHEWNGIVAMILHLISPSR